MSNNKFHLLALTNHGDLHTIRKSNGNWYHFGDFRAATNNSLPSDIYGISAAGIGDELHVCIEGRYKLFHAIRFGDGSWTIFGDIGIATQYDSDQWGALGRLSCASVSGELHVSALASGGAKLLHAIRHQDGTWTQFGDVLNETGVQGLAFGLLFTACTEVDGELHICLIDNNFEIWHSIRHKNGTWDAIQNLNLLANFSGKATSLSCAGVNGELHLVYSDYDSDIRGTRNLRHAIRHSDNSWTAFVDVKAQAGDHGGVSKLSCAEVQGELQLVVATEFLPNLWHTIRFQNGAWQQFGNVELAVAGQVEGLIFYDIACAGVDQGTYELPPIDLLTTYQPPQ